MQAGAPKLVFEYVRFWLPSDQPRDTFSLTVNAAFGHAGSGEDFEDDAAIEHGDD